MSNLIDEIGFDNNEIVSSKLNFYKGERDRIDQVSFPFPAQIKRAKVHYDKELGYFHCTGGYCCQKFKPSYFRMVTVIIRWDMDRDGMPIIPFKGRPEVLFISENRFIDIKNANKRFPVAENDILIRCVEEIFQKLSIQSAGSSILLNKNLTPDVKDSLIKASKDMLDRVDIVLAKKYTDMELRERMGDTGTVEFPQNVASEVNFDDMITSLPTAPKVGE